MGAAAWEPGVRGSEGRPGLPGPPRSPAAPAPACAAALQEFKGYVFKIMGGQDKQGFPMKQGVLTNGRVQVRTGRCHFPWGQA